MAFFTLFERKILGYVHFRLGPNKNALLGIGQPFRDLVKLFGKIEHVFSMSSLFTFFLSPFMMVLFASFLWIIFSHHSNRNMFKYFFLSLIAANGLLTFFFLFPGWRRGSSYSALGGYRSSAQCISYEGIFFFCVITMIFLFFSFRILEGWETSLLSNNLILFSPLIFCWLVSILAERNRSPFDFAEGERELVSGFNTEYGRGLFSIIFLREYISILFYRFFSSYILFGSSSIILFIFFLLILLYIWIRTAFPRLRYDKLIVLAWKRIIFFITRTFLLFRRLLFF